MSTPPPDRRAMTYPFLRVGRKRFVFPLTRFLRSCLVPKVCRSIPARRFGPTKGFVLYGRQYNEMYGLFACTQTKGDRCLSSESNRLPFFLLYGPNDCLRKCPLFWVLLKRAVPEKSDKDL